MEPHPPPFTGKHTPAAPANPDQAARLAAIAERRSGARADTGHPPPAPGRRRHPARGARVAALGLSLISTGGLAAVFALTNAHAGTQVQAASVISGTTPAIAATTAPSLSTTETPSAPPTTSASASPTTTAPVTSTGGVVDGAVFHNKWGDVQVEATFAADGSLIDVAALQTPYVDHKSVSINGRAVPQLNAAALTAQSAHVDTVSGATYTSTDYRRSLQSAIDAARDAGITTIA